MAIVGHGIDLVEDKRIEFLLRDESWSARVFTEGERKLASSRSFPSKFYAGRFAAKEAVVKALGTGFTAEVHWQSIEVNELSDGVPSIRLVDGALRRANDLSVKDWHLSISHSCGFSIASVIAES